MFLKFSLLLEQIKIKLCGFFAGAIRHFTICSRLFPSLRERATAPVIFSPASESPCNQGLWQLLKPHRRGGRVVEGAPLLREITRMSEVHITI